MQWYYAVSDQRKGPVAQAEFERLVAEGTIRGDTLVWRQGMAEWQPYSAVVATGVASGVASAGTPVGSAATTNDARVMDDDSAVCAVSGRRYPKREMIQYEGKWIAAEHRDAYFQRMREGVAQVGDGPVPGPFGYGGFWRRFFARLVDGIVQAIPMMLVVGAFTAYFATRGTMDLESPGAAILFQVGIQLFATLFALAYEVFFIRKFDATPGKMALGMKLLRSDGSKLSIGRIVGRYFASLLSGMIFLIGYIMAAFDDEKRTLHDRIVDTRVIKTR